MAKEVLAIPEDRLLEVIAVIRYGVAYVKEHFIEVSQEVIEQLEKWCDEEEEYISQWSTGITP